MLELLSDPYAIARDSQYLVTCVYRKLKPGGNDGEARPRWRANL
jgi:hypothetical protein